MINTKIKKRITFLLYALIGEPRAKKLLKNIQLPSNKYVEARTTKDNVSTSNQSFEKETKNYRQILEKAPTNGELHFDFCQDCLKTGKYNLAYAELCTASFLGVSEDKIQSIKPEIKSKLSPLECLNHNQYFRLKSLAEEIKSLQGQENWSVLDVGGGNGNLSLFLPNSPYCLAEPSVNGISGTNLPFTDKTFDLVVSCHVLEHIPIPEREIFLDNLISKAKKAVILLNPFEVKGTFVKERLELTISVTNADWAKEHLECSLPTVESIKLYGQKRGLNYTIKPNGSVTTSLVMVFMDYFAKKAGLGDDLSTISQFYNKNYLNILDSETYPNAYLVTFKLD